MKTFTVIATITLVVETLGPETVAHVAERRLRETGAWMKRHWRDFEADVPSVMDMASYNVQLKVEEIEP